MTAMEMLRPSEAAVVAGVSLRDVNRAFDEHILPEGHIIRDDGRFVSLVACVFISFYFGSADRLTSKERLDTISRITWKQPKAFKLYSWKVDHDFLTIDLAPFAKETQARLYRLQAARELVETSEDILNGTPVIKGTRVPVLDVAASVAAGHPTERILAAYPALTREQVELAVTYAQANPSRGRPRAGHVVPGGAEIIAQGHLPRRRRAG